MLTNPPAHGRRFLCVLITLLLCGTTKAFAQLSDDATEQREFLQIDQIEEDRFQVIESVDQLYEQIRKRAEDKIKERKRRWLKKTRITVSVFGGYETNPLSEPDEGGDEEGDGFIAESLKLQWLPKFSKHLKADVGYRIYNKTYFDSSDLNYMKNSLKGSLKFYPFKGLRIEPGIEYSDVHYFNDDRARYGRLQPFIKFKSYVSKKWNYGGSYDFSIKEYDERLARTGDGTDISGKERKDNRHTFNLYVTKYFGNISVRIRGRYLRNDSNDIFEDFYDYDSYRGYLTFGKKFLDDKLYVAFTPSYEERKYDGRRATGSSVREDEIMAYNLSFYYEVAKDLDLRYSFYYRDSNSNSSSGEFSNMINTIGFTKKF